MSPSLRPKRQKDFL